MQLLLISILVAGFFIRIVYLRSKGLFLWDEAAYYREAQFGIKAISFYKKHFFEIIRLRFHPDDKKKDVLLQDCIWRDYLEYTYHKAWHFYINIIFAKLIKRKDYAIVVPSLVMGIATILLTYLVAAAVFGQYTGILATIILALSGLHIIHSRSAEPEMGVAFSFLLMIYLSVINKLMFKDVIYDIHSALQVNTIVMHAGIGCFLAGIICFNIRWAPLFPLAYILSEIFYAFLHRNIPLGAFVISQVIVLFTAAVVLMLTDVPFIINRVLFPEIKATPHTKKIFLDLRRQWIRLRYMVSGEKDDAEKMGVVIPKWFNLTFYPEVLMHTEGVAVSVFALAGSVIPFIKGNPLQMYIAFLGIFVYVFLTFVPYKASRAIVNTLPLISIYAAYMINLLSPYLAYPIIALIILRGIKYSRRVINMKSGMKKAAEYVLSKGENRFATTSVPFSMLYGDPEFISVTANTIEKLAKYYNVFGVKYFIMDHHIHYPTIIDPVLNHLIEENVEPIYIAEDPAVTFYPLLAECEYHTPRSLQIGSVRDVTHWNRFRQKPREIDKYVRVYGIADIVENSKLVESSVEMMIYEGDLLTERNNYKDALFYYKKAERRRPDEPMIKLKIGICQKMLGRPEWTAKIYRDLLKKDTLPPDIRRVCEDFVRKHEQGLIE